MTEEERADIVSKLAQFKILNKINASQELIEYLIEKIFPDVKVQAMITYDDLLELWRSFLLDRKILTAKDFK